MKFCDLRKKLSNMHIGVFFPSPLVKDVFVRFHRQYRLYLFIYQPPIFEKGMPHI